MNNNKTIKVLYHVDIDDNTKTPFMAFESDKELRNIEVIEQIGEQIELHGFGKRGVCNSVAWELVHNGSAVLTCIMGEYEFGIDEVELFK